MTRFEIDRSKAAIKDHRVFEGLIVDDPAKFADLFMRPQFQLVCYKIEGREHGWIIYEIVNDSFVFHLVNFTQVSGHHDITDSVFEKVVLPVCVRNGLKYIQASVERAGMARKLKSKGFERYSGRVYRGEVSHVF